ncbi:hypothetical protein [Pandoraea fibrosis]|nr:hypothetical protein [Pandoraea fibrosis]
MTASSLTRVTPSANEPATPLAEDFARAQQAAAQASMTPHALPWLSAQLQTHAAASVQRELTALAPISAGRRSSAPAAPSSRTSTVDAPVFSIDMLMGYGADRTRRIFDSLWQDVAMPALRAMGTSSASGRRRPRFEPLRPAGAGGSDDTPQAPADQATHPWHDTLHSHLHKQARILAHHGFDVADVFERLEVLLREQRPGFSWRSFYIGTLRDAMPFAVGSALVSLLAESTDPTRSQAWLWPPLAALGVVLINLLGMAGFNTTQVRHRNRIARTTPAPGLEGLSAILSTPYRAAFAQVLGFVFCYGVLRNGARYGIERVVSHFSPGILTRRFGDTLHASLEVPLAPIPGFLLLPIIHQLGMTRHSASLQVLTQHNFAELIEAVGHAPAPADQRSLARDFFRDLSTLLQSTPPRLIWFALTVTFYYLAWMGDYAAHAHGSTDDSLLDDDLYGRNATLPTAGTHTPTAAEEAHVFAVLDVLYGVIGLIFSISQSAAQREDIRTAHERRAPQQKISTSTVVTIADSGVSSGYSSPRHLDSPGSPEVTEVNNNTTSSASFTFPQPDAHGASAPVSPDHGIDDVPPSPPKTAGTGRRHGTTTVPSALCRPRDLPWWRSPPPDSTDDEIQQSTPL